VGNRAGRLFACAEAADFGHGEKRQRKKSRAQNEPFEYFLPMYAIKSESMLFILAIELSTFMKYNVDTKLYS
jgi:hypothetical protein